MRLKKLILFGSTVILMLVYIGCKKEAKVTLPETDLEAISLINKIDEDKVKEDITLILSIHNNETYLRAKSLIVTTDDTLVQLFSYSSYIELSLEYMPPEVTINSIKVDYSEKDTDAIRYSTLVSRRRGTMIEKYYVILSYEDDSILEYKAYEL